MEDVEYRVVNGKITYNVEARRTYNRRWEVNNGYYTDISGFRLGYGWGYSYG
jgi:hypothetical protein